MNTLNHAKPKWGSVESLPLAWNNSKLRKVLKMSKNKVLSLFTYLVERYCHFEDGLLANEASKKWGALMP